MLKQWDIQMKINETDNSYCPLIFNGLYLRRHHVHMVSYGNPLSFDNVLPEEVDPFLLELEKFKDYYWYNQIKNAVIQ